MISLCDSTAANNWWLGSDREAWRLSFRLYQDICCSVKIPVWKQLWIVPSVYTTKVAGVLGLHGSSGLRSCRSRFWGGFWTEISICVPCIREQRCWKITQRTFSTNGLPQQWHWGAASPGPGSVGGALGGGVGLRRVGRAWLPWVLCEAAVAWAGAHSELPFLRGRLGDFGDDFKGFSVSHLTQLCVWGSPFFPCSPIGTGGLGLMARGETSLPRGSHFT